MQTNKEDRKCSFCFQVFLRSEHLARHLRTHTGEKPFACNVCQKSYARYDTLLRHKRSHRGNSSPLNASPSSGTQESGNERLSQAGRRREAGGTCSPHSHGPNAHQSPVQAGHSAPAWIDQSLVGTVYLSPESSSGQISQEVSTLQGAGPFAAEVEFPVNEYDIPGFTHDQAWTTWSVGSDFDLDAMNAAIAATVHLDHVPGMHAVYPDHLPSSDVSVLPSRGQTTPNSLVETIERCWLSYNRGEAESTAVAGTITPIIETGSGERHDIDETYRFNLSSRLQYRPYDNSLPSTEFLNSAVRLYFARFHPIFPIIHAPTFRPSNATSLLLLSICSIGSLFMGSSSAISQGTKIFETLNKCIINSWDRYLARSSIEALSMIQASLLGQTFAILSGVPARLNLAQVYHGTIVAWARQGKMFKERPNELREEMMETSPPDLDNIWKAWAHSQQRIRLVLGVHIHDTELAVLFHHEPLLRHAKENSRISSSEQMFSASTASIWLKLARDVVRKTGSLNSTTGLHMQSQLNGIDNYARLNSIAAAICENRQQGHLGAGQQSHFLNALMEWQKEAQWVWKDQSPDPFCLTILWHSTLISLFSDSEKMECAMGKEGLAGASLSLGYVTEWASSESAQRCLLHAFLLQKKVESIQFGHEPALHVPRCLFQAASVWYLYSQHAADDTVRLNVEFPELKQLGTAIPQTWFSRAKKENGKSPALESSTLYTLKDLLQRVGRWGLSKKYASILGLLIEDHDSISWQTG